MTVNIEALIDSLGKSYQEIIDSELITYKTPPKAPSGSPTLRLNMAKEGVFLAFKRDGRILSEISLTIQDEDEPKWRFPNPLPSPFIKEMTRQWIHTSLGTPERSAPPEVILKKAFGWTDLFNVIGAASPTTLQINYDMEENVRLMTYMLTSDLRW